MDHDGFVAFAQKLPAPDLAQLLRDSEPLSDIATLRHPSSIRRRYEKMHNFPDGLLVCADALCSFNPTFGQGITVAAKEALVLQDLCVRGRTPHLGKVFLRKVAPIVDVAWNASIGRLFSFKDVVGRPTFPMRVANAYLPKVIARAHEDVTVATALLRVMQFLAPPESLFSPRVLMRVFRGRSARSWRADSGSTQQRC